MPRIAATVKRLRSGGIPARHVVIDTEAATRLRHGQQEQSWALGVAAYLTRSNNGDLAIRSRSSYSAPADMWADIAAFTRARTRTVVWAHNLAYDLRISDALRQLPALGWSLQGIVLERTSSWAAFTRDGATIMCCDLFAWFPADLAKIADDVGLSRPPFDYEASTAAELIARCIADIEITAEAVRQLVAFLTENDLGPWRPTGAGQSIAAWRTRWLTHPPLIHDDPVALAAERVSMWTGRCEAWRWGKITGPAVTEYDLSLAYCRIAAACDVPVRLATKVGAIKPWDYTRLRKRYAILAEVSVITDEPIVPAAYGDRIHWPVGRFETVLWDPEIDALLAAGATVAFRRAWCYHRAPALSAMAHWIIEALHPDNATTTPLARRMLKHWSRAIVGRQALRYREWEAFGTDTAFDLNLGILIDLEAGTLTDMLQVGHDLMTLAELTEADSSVPQITGWVMSEARRRLWELTTVAGADHVLYIDTDSLIVDQTGALRLSERIGADGAYGLVRKTRYQHLTIHGPRNLEIGGVRRLAGIPTRAVQTGPLEYSGEVWRSIKESMTRGELSTVVISPRTFTVRTDDPRRTRLPGGQTIPHREEPYASAPAVR